MNEYKRLLPIYSSYYENQFPYELVYEWFSYGGQVPAAQREWSYEGLNDDDSSFIKRFVVVKSPQDLRNLTFDTLTLKMKFDIGPVYSSDIAFRQSQKITPIQREFVFDVDSGDFDSVRRCCQGTQMCNKCWRFMECAMCVLVLFCKVYGFEHYIFAFSGRRGMHCWICDERARNLDEQTRLNMLKMFNLIMNDNEQLEMIAYDCFVVDQIFKICEEFFCRMYSEQNWEQSRDIEKFVEKFNKMKGKTLQGKTDAKAISALELKAKVKPEFWRYLCIYFTYPRFDIEVTKSMVHLLKIPFSVHRKSLKVAVPMNPEPVLREYGIEYLSVWHYESLEEKFVFENAVGSQEDLTEYIAFLAEFLRRLAKNE